METQNGLLFAVFVICTLFSINHPLLMSWCLLCTSWCFVHTFLILYDLSAYHNFSYIPYIICIIYIYIYCQSHAYLATDVHQGFYVFFMKSWPPSTPAGNPILALKKFPSFEVLELEKTCISKYSIYTWNPNVPCFDWKKTFFWR